MTLIYILLGFTGLAGAAIAKDDLEHAGKPKLDSGEETQTR